MASAAGYAAAALALPAGNRPADVWAFVALFGLLFVLMAAAWACGRRAFAAGRGKALGTVLLFALVFRLLLVPAGLASGGPGAFALEPGARLAGLAADLAGRRVAFAEHLLYDDDVWRYLWDGHVAAAGLDPYRASPRELEERAEAGEPAAEALLAPTPWWDVLDQVGFPTYRTVYPPGAQLLFLLVHALAPASVVAWKLLVITADLGTCWLLVRLLRRLGRPEHEAILYAWNPLVVKELAGSGHVDGVMVLLAVLAVERLLARSERTALAALAASALTKAGSAVLAPLFLLRTLACSRPRNGLRTVVRSWWALPAAGAALCLPFLDGLPELGRSLAVYGREWAFNTGPWGAVAWAAAEAGTARPEAWAHGITKAVLLAVLAASAWRGRRSDRSVVEAAFVSLAATAWLAPAVMPWYLLWALPFAVAAGWRSWPLLTALSLLSYLVYAHHGEQAWWLWIEHGTFAAAVSWEALGRRAGRRSARPGQRRRSRRSDSLL